MSGGSAAYYVNESMSESSGDSLNNSNNTSNNAARVLQQLHSARNNAEKNNPFGAKGKIKHILSMKGFSNLDIFFSAT